MYANNTKWVDEALVNAAEEYYKTLPKPDQPVNITEPLDAEGKTDYGKVSQVQKDLQPDGFYEQQISKGNLTVEQVKAIVKSAGLNDSIVDGIKFRIDNPDLIKSLQAGIPKGINISYLRSDLNTAIKDGRFGEVIKNGDVSVEKAKEILNYFHIRQFFDHAHNRRVVQFTHTWVDHLLEQSGVFDRSRNGNIIFPGGIQNNFQILQLHMCLETGTAIAIEQSRRLHVERFAL